MESELTIFSWLFSQFDVVLNNYITQNVTDIITAISPAAWIMFGIYIVLWGFSAIRGQIDEPMTDALFRLLKIALVLGIALNVGRYQEYVVDFVMETPAAMADALALSGGPESGDESTYGAIDNILNKTIDAAGKAWDKMSVFSPGQAMGLGIAAILILIAGLIFTITAGIMIIMAKVGMVLMLALGPIFIIMAMFQTTQRFFDSWLGQVLNFMLTLVLVLAVCSLFFRMCEEVITKAGAVVDADPLQAVATVAVATVACTFLLFQVAPLASALAGGIALPVSQAAKKLSGGGIADSLGHAASRKVAGKAVDFAAAKMTGGASVVAQRVGNMFKASNSIKRR